MRAALIRPRIAIGEHERKPEIDLARERDAAGHDADDFVIPSVEGQRPADNGTIAAETTLPQPMTEHDDPRASGLFLVRPKPSSEKRRDAQDPEQVRADVRTIQAFRIEPAAKGRRRVVVGRDGRQGAVLRFPVDEIRWRDRRQRAARGLVDLDDSTGSGVG